MKESVGGMLDGWMSERMGGWNVGWMDGWMSERMGGWNVGWMDE